MALPLIHPERIHTLRGGPSGTDTPGAGPVLVWMHREMRAPDNWTLLLGQRLALEAKVPLAVVFCLSPTYGQAAWRQYHFLLGGLDELARDLDALNIPLFVEQGRPGREVATLAGKLGARCLVTDLDPARDKQVWIRDAARALDIPIHEVDSRNVVPARTVTDKREWMARTLRPKIQRRLDEFLVPFPEIAPHPYRMDGPGAREWMAGREGLVQGLDLDRGVAPVDWIRPGPQAALGGLDRFIKTGLDRYAAESNDPNAKAVSLLSPWLHFGHLSAQRVALSVAGSRGADPESVRAFLEQLIVRRELAENYCLHTPAYDSVDGYPDWAGTSLAEHADDPREYLYSEEELEQAETHDPLWNAAQLQMVSTGHMHSWLRMYWAKKILEWSPRVEDAQARAVRLNDRWQLDGRDVNGWTGIAWSLGGVHDQGWKERPIFGKVRYMNYRGAKRKFDVARFVKDWGQTPL